jgi:hypothetical protein
MIKGSIDAWLNREVKPSQLENEYTPKRKLALSHTVFPNWSNKFPTGKPIFSPNGTGQWYGLIEGIKSNLK